MEGRYIELIKIVKSAIFWETSRVFLLVLKFEKDFQWCEVIVNNFNYNYCTNVLFLGCREFLN